MTVALYKNELHTVWILETNQLLQASCLPSHERHPLKITWDSKPPPFNEEMNTKIQQRIFTKSPNEPSSCEQAQHQPLTKNKNKKGAYHWVSSTNLTTATKLKLHQTNRRVTLPQKRLFFTLHFSRAGHRKVAQKGGIKWSCYNFVRHKERVIGIETRARAHPLQQCKIKWQSWVFACYIDRFWTLLAKLISDRFPNFCARLGSLKVTMLVGWSYS